jgi:hypothetical protein
MSLKDNILSSKFIIYNYEFARKGAEVNITRHVTFTETKY